MPQYVLVARDAGSWSELAGDISPEEIQAILSRYSAWNEKLAAAGKLVGGQKLKDGEGRVVQGKGSAMKVMDGPHAESKEVIGGFWIVEAANYEEAVRLASDNPHLDFGSLEVREIEEMAG